MTIAQQQDRTSKWFLKQQTPALLKICDFKDVEGIRVETAEMVAPRRIADGIIYVKFKDNPIEVPFIIEFESYPSTSNSQQIAEDMMTYFLTERRLPEAILFVLRPSPQSTPNADYSHRDRSESIQFMGELGTSSINVRWRTINAWEKRAEDLFALNDPNVVPMIPLTQSDLSPEELLRRCRKVIDDSDVTNKTDLLVVTELFASFMYDDDRLLEILREGKMIEFPIIKKLQEVSEEKGRNEGIDIGRNEGIDIGRDEGRLQAICQSIVDVLETRFGVLPVTMTERLKAMTSVEQLKPLLKIAASCPDVATFEQSL